MQTFEEWVRVLGEDVIQGEYGYEPNEFSIYPDLWEAAYREGLTPHDAFARSLKAYSDDRAARKATQAMNWERIQAEDREVIAKERGESA
jgi:hypothetical protein